MGQPNNNDVVILQLDRPREVRYGHKALKQLGALTGKSLEQLDAGDINFEELEKYLYCGLLTDAKKNNEKLTLDQMEDLLDQAPRYSDVLTAMQQAFANAFGALNGGQDEGNVQTEQPGK